jgi:predicted nucleotide-binding protein
MTASALIQYLFDVAESAAKLKDNLEVGDLSNQLSALAQACDAVRRGWSGSNIGYHATVYWSGLQAKPPHVEFSTEWGLMDRWPVHEPASGWTQMDYQHVVDVVRKRAGNPDTDEMKAKVERSRSDLLDLKETATSILSTILAERKDPFLRKKLDQVEKLVAPEISEVIRALLPKGQVWSRDSLAMSQGLKIAPHQAEAALSILAEALVLSLRDLERAAREAASHLKRTEVRAKKSEVIGTNIFLGHGRSPLWRELKDFMDDRLGLPVDEFNSVPIAGITTTARLSELLDAAAFAFLIMTAEDESTDGSLHARENVIHEVGLFQGRLGFTKAIVLLEEGCTEFSNIHGLGQIRFPKQNVKAIFEDVRAVLEREGLLST